MQFDYIKEYRQKFGEIIISEKTELENKLKELEKEEEEIQNMYQDNIIDDYSKIEHIFEESFCYSLTVMIYTLLEKNINKICNWMQHFKSLDSKLNEIDGQGIERAKNYLKKVVKIQIDENDKIFLDKINTIRNALAHVNGDIRDIDNERKIKKLKQFSKKIPGYSLNKNETKIELNLEFIDYCINNSLILFKNLFDELTKI
jgi:hypothetical protein